MIKNNQGIFKVARVKNLPPLRKKKNQNREKKEDQEKNHIIKRKRQIGRAEI